MLHKGDGTPAARRIDTGGSLRRTQTGVAAALERRAGNRLLSAWQRACAQAEMPSLTALEEAAGPELMHRTILLRVGAKAALTIERFGPPDPAGAAPAAGMRAPITPMVVSWIRSIANSALRQRAPKYEAGEVPIGNYHLCYRCVVVPVSADGKAIDTLVGVLGYRWARSGGQAQKA